jgi:multidrug efflux pump subunit AcrB
MPKINSYFEQLQYDKRLNQTTVYKYITNVRLVALLVITVVLVGLISYFSLPRRLNPEVKIPYIVVTTVLPGAGPDDVESLVTIPLEDEILSIEGIDTLNSTSQESISVITAEFATSVDSDFALNEVQKAVDSVKDLPDDATTPSVSQVDFEDQPVWTFALSTNADVATLMSFASNLQDRIEFVPYVDRVEINGKENYSIQVIIDPEKLQQYGLDPITLSRLINSEVSSYPAGTIETNASEFSFTIDPSVESIADIRNLNLSFAQTEILLSDVADVIERPTPEITKTYIVGENGEVERAVSFTVYKRLSANIDETIDAVKLVVDEEVGQYNGQFEVTPIVDTSKLIDEQFASLGSNFATTILLVFLVLLLFLGIRQAVVVSISIPLTFLVSFIAMRLTGISINFLSLFSLLLALGLVVDDAIVIISAMTNYHKTKRFTEKETGMLVWKDFIVPIWTTTITTVWAFIPLLLATGIIGEFIKSIPIVVSATLLASTTIAVLVTLPLMIVVLKVDVPNRVKVFANITLMILLGALIIVLSGQSPLLPLIILLYLALLLVIKIAGRKAVLRIKGLVSWNTNKARENKKLRRVRHGIMNGFVSFDTIKLRYRAVMSGILEARSNRRATLIIVVVFAVFSYLLVPFGFVVNEFFPKTDSDNVYIELELPSGTNVDVTEEQVFMLLESLEFSTDVDSIVLEVGKGYSGDGFSAGSSTSNLALISLILYPEEKRDQTSIEIASDFREQVSSYTKGNVSIYEQSAGPPAGSDIQIKLVGEDLGVLDEYANEVVVYLKNEPGTTNINKSIRQSTGKIVFVPDNTKLNEVGLSVDSLGLWMRTFTSGFTLDSVKFNGNDDIDVEMRMSLELQSPEGIGRLYIPTQRGFVPLTSLGSLVLKPNPTKITREDGARTISVTAGVEENYSMTEINAGLTDFADNGLGLPDGYSWKTGGANEENQRSVGSILQAMIISAILILITMVIQLKSFRKSFIVLMVIPLAISGVFIIFALTQTPLSFPALIGVLALFGIVVNNSIMLVEKINQNREANMDLKTSITDASSNRLEPIALSSLTTIFGLLPITISDPLWRGLGGAIIAGLAFSGIVMLFFIPVLYYVMFEGEDRELLEGESEE